MEDNLNTMRTMAHTGFTVYPCADASLNNQQLTNRAHGAHTLYTNKELYIIKAYTQGTYITLHALWENPCAAWQKVGFHIVKCCVSTLISAHGQKTRQILPQL